MPSANTSLLRIDERSLDTNIGRDDFLLLLGSLKTLLCFTEVYLYIFMQLRLLLGK